MQCFNCMNVLYESFLTDIVIGFRVFGDGRHLRPNIFVLLLHSTSERGPPLAHRCLHVKYSLAFQNANLGASYVHY